MDIGSQNWLLAGGPVVWLLMGLSVIALTVILMKFFQFFVQSPLKGNAAEMAKKALFAGQLNEAQQAVIHVKHPRARVMAKVLDHFAKQDLPPENQRNEALRIAKTELASLSDYLRVLEVIAIIAPLLGLFGTVLGMIEAFQAMEAAGRDVNPAVLSGGIWVALLTTAVGLAVAIPVSMANSWFERRVEREAQAMSNDLDEVFFHQVETRTCCLAQGCCQEAAKMQATKV